jgi:hypothetical protein
MNCIAYLFCHILKLARLALLGCHIEHCQQISLGVPESGPIRADESGMLRESGKPRPARECLSLALNS